ncbi:hypothetical protein Q0N12_09530 [Rossellomorea marisflavi]|uniref:hypothetical protein n=1 Tax=Rossellomorea marisflavi TaxID=189381 RepID=UPI0034591F63
MIFLIVGFIALVVLIVLFLLPKGRYLLIIPPAVYVAIVLTGALSKSNDPMYDVWEFKFALSQFIAIPLFIFTGLVVLVRLYWRKKAVV